MLERAKIFAESWNVAFRKKSRHSILDDTESVFTVVPNSFRYWAADPFLFEYEGETYIFAELYDYILRRGVLGFCRIKGDKTTKWTPVIIEDYHLSFPNIYRDGDDIYIMPESHKCEQLYRYKAIDFPTKWQKENFYIDNAKFTDTVWLEQEQFALTYELTEGKPAQLVLLDLQNNKKTVLQSDADELLRPAGAVIEAEKLRPAQICVPDYGKGIIFYEISFEPVAGSYSEYEKKRLYPDELKLSKMMLTDGMHTYNASEHYEVIDIKTRRFNLLNLLFRLIHKLW